VKGNTARKLDGVNHRIMTMKAQMDMTLPGDEFIMGYRVECKLIPRQPLCLTV
jgi:hypothetical protein